MASFSASRRHDRRGTLPFVKCGFLLFCLAFGAVADPVHLPVAASPRANGVEDEPKIRERAATLLVADLDDDAFRIRRRAQLELARRLSDWSDVPAASAALDALKRARAKPASAEQSRSAEQLLSVHDMGASGFCQRQVELARTAANSFLEGVMAAPNDTGLQGAYMAFGRSVGLESYRHEWAPHTYTYRSRWNKTKVAPAAKNFLRAVEPLLQTRDLAISKLELIGVPNDDFTVKVGARVKSRDGDTFSAILEFYQESPLVRIEVEPDAVKALGDVFTPAQMLLMGVPLGKAKVFHDTPGPKWRMEIGEAGGEHRQEGLNRTALATFAKGAEEFRKRIAPLFPPKQIPPMDCWHFSGR